MSNTTPKKAVFVPGPLSPTSPSNNGNPASQPLLQELLTAYQVREFNLDKLVQQLASTNPTIASKQQHQTELSIRSLTLVLSAIVHVLQKILSAATAAAAQGATSTVEALLARETWDTCLRIDAHVFAVVTGDRNAVLFALFCEVSAVRRTLTRCVALLCQIYTTTSTLAPSVVSGSGGGKQTASLLADRLFKALNALALRQASGERAATSSLICICNCLSALYVNAASIMPAMTQHLPTLSTKIWARALPTDEDIKIAMLELVKDYCTSGNRNILHNDWSEIVKLCKLALSEPRFASVRLSAGRCLQALASNLTPAHATNKNFEPTLQMIVKAMEDMSASPLPGDVASSVSANNVRFTFGKAAAQMLLGVMDEQLSMHSDTAATNADDSNKSNQGVSIFGRVMGKKAAAQPQSKAYVFSSSLILLTAPFAKAGAPRALRQATCVAVVHYLRQCSPALLYSNMDVLILHLLSLLSNTKSFNTVPGELQHAMFLVGSMIRQGISFHVDEPGRIVAIKEMLKIVDRFSSNEYALVCLLRELAVLCKLLGEVVIHQRDAILDAVLLCLRHQSEYVRYVGCMVLRALAEAIPTQVMSLVNAMLNMVQMDLAELAAPSKEAIEIQFSNSLHGHSNALAALISVTSKNALSVSHLLCSAALDTSTLLASKKSASHNQYVNMRREEACWTLVSAVLSLNDTWLKNNITKIMDLWEMALGGKVSQPTTPSTSTSAATANISNTSVSQQATSIQTAANAVDMSERLDMNDQTVLLRQLRSRSMAILSIAIFLKRCGLDLLSKEQLAQVCRYLENTLALLNTLPIGFRPPSIVARNALTILRMYLFEAFRRLPTEILGSKQYKSTINLATKLAFAEADGTLSHVETSLLRTVMDSTQPSSFNSTNGWQQDIMKDLLDEIDVDGSTGFTFSSDGAAEIVLEDDNGIPEMLLQADSLCIFSDSSKFFMGRPLSLNARLVDSSIKLLARLFVLHKSQNRKQIVDHYISQVKFVLGRPDDIRISQVVFTNIVASMYCFLSSLLASKEAAEAELEENGGVAAKQEDRSYLSSMHVILNSSLGHINGKIRRAASECLAMLGQLVGKVLIEDLIKRCAAKIAATDSPVLAGYALALGSVNQALGSLTSMQFLPSTVSFLQNMMRAWSQSPKVQLSALHSLFLTIESSGASFSSHVGSTLQLMSSLIFAPNPSSLAVAGGAVAAQASAQSSGSLASDRYNLLGCSRIITALLGLGPEVTSNSEFVQLYRFFIYDFLNYSRYESIQLEGALLVQRAAILAPHLLQSVSQVLLPKLRDMLLSEQTGNNLRQVVAGTIKIIAERQPEAVSVLFPLDALFVLLNAEHERHSRLHFEEIIHLLLRSKVYPPKRWVQFIHQVINSQARAVAGQEETATGGELVSDVDARETEDAAQGSSAAKVSKERNQDAVFCWQTKLFALACLRSLMELNSGGHTASSQNQLHIPKESINQIVDICTIAASRGTSVSVIREGLLALKTLIELYGDVPDPDVAGEVLLQQHSAKFSTAISQGFQSGNSPLLISAAAELAAALLSSNIVRNETSTITRTSAFLTDNLPKLKELHFSQYGEVSAAMVRVAILQALAEIFVSADETGSTHPPQQVQGGEIADSKQDIAVVLQPHIETHLIQYWSCMLYDFSVLSSTDGARTKDAGGAAASDKLTRHLYEDGLEKDVKQYFEHSYSTVLNALMRACSVSTNMVDPALVFGLSVRGLYDRATWRGHTGKDSALRLIDALRRGVERASTYLSSGAVPYAADMMFELFLMLVKVQQDRDVSLQLECLKLAQTILQSFDGIFFARCTLQNLQVVLTTIVECCLKPLKLQFPAMFDQDSELSMQQAQLALSKEQLEIVQRSCRCLQLTLSAFCRNITPLAGNVTSVLYALVRMMQFTQGQAAVHVLELAQALPKLAVSDVSMAAQADEDSPTAWTVAFEAAIDNVLSRIDRNVAVSASELELAFVLCSGLPSAQHTSSLSRTAMTLAKVLLRTGPNSSQTDLNTALLVLKGIQDGLIRLAKSSETLPVALHSASTLAPVVITFASSIAQNPNGDKTGHDYLQFILMTVPSSLNVLLAVFSLMSSSPVQKSGFLLVVVPLLVLLLRFADPDKYTLPGTHKHMLKLYNLLVECMERIASLAVAEFRELLASGQLTPDVTQEIQAAATKKRQYELNQQKKIEKQKQRLASKKESLTINFGAYTAQGGTANL